MSDGATPQTPLGSLQRSPRLLELDLRRPTSKGVEGKGWGEGEGWGKEEGEGTPPGACLNPLI